MRIDEKIIVHINNLDQGMFIQTDDIEKPVLLFLHGGPGQPTITICDKYPTGIEVPKLEIPVYIFQGKYDYQVSYQLAKEYAKIIQAPLVGFYTFLDSAHSPCFEEPEKMIRVIKTDVLNKQTTLADQLR